MPAFRAWTNISLRGGQKHFRWGYAGAAFDLLTDKLLEVVAYGVAE